ncbi:hypothetical protein BH10ACI2_BH10ACI2_23860 [soil metagenome]
MPTFHQLRTYFFESTPASGFMDIADVNGDHLPDIMTGESVSGGGTTMTVMLGTGATGGFQQETNVSVGGSPRAITTGDVNNDGFVDILNTQFGGIEMYLGNGTGTSWTMQYYVPATGIGFLFKTIAKDLNNDGKLDLIISDNRNHSIYIRFGNGDGTFSETQNLTNTGEWIYADDINNDGYTDLVASGDLDHFTYTYFGRPDGTFGPGISYRNVPGWDLQLIDLDHDGYKDLFSASYHVFIHFNDGAGGFGPLIETPLEIPAGTNVASGQGADFDGDGILDVAVLTGSGELHVFKGLSLYSFQDTSPIRMTYSVYSLHVDDLNNDGMPDISFVGYDIRSAYTVINKCGDNRPVAAIAGSFSSFKGYDVSGARINLESVESGVLGASGGTGRNFLFTDLPVNGNYKLTPTHPLFTFEPASVQVNNLTAFTTVEFIAHVKYFKVYGDVIEYVSPYQTPAENVLVRLVGPFSIFAPYTDLRSPQIDETVRTNAQGKYVFKELLPTAANQIYQIQFPADTFWHGITPVKAFSVGASDVYQGFYAGRNQYSVGVHLTMPNGRPRAGATFFLNQIQWFQDRQFTTNADGRGAIDNLPAGRSHSVYNSIPSLRFTPDPATASYLTSNTEIETLVTQKNAGDFDNDAKTDVAVWRPDSGNWFTQRSSDGGLTAAAWGLPGDIPVPADYDGDKKTDIAIFRPSNGTWYLILSTVGGVPSVQFGNPGDIPVPADLDRDGKADYVVFRPSNGTWYSILSSGQQSSPIPWGANGDRPIVGDFDGDTYADLAFFRPSDGTWHIRLYAGGERTVQLGSATDKILTGDFDGDTISDICVWRPETGVWSIIKSSNSELKTVQFGIPGDRPLAGDFDGDGIADLAVYRPSTGTWTGINSSNSSVWSTSFGLADDIPLSSISVR